MLRGRGRIARGEPPWASCPSECQVILHGDLTLSSVLCSWLLKLQTAFGHFSTLDGESFHGFLSPPWLIFFCIYTRLLSALPLVPFLNYSQTVISSDTKSPWIVTDKCRQHTHQIPHVHSRKTQVRRAGTASFLQINMAAWNSRKFSIQEWSTPSQAPYHRMRPVTWCGKS